MVHPGQGPRERRLRARATWPRCSTTPPTPPSATWTRAGIDVITDGEVRRLDGYVDSYYTIIKNIQPIEIRRKDGPWGYDQQTRYEATGRIEMPEGGLGIIDEFKYAMATPDKPLKATCAGPLTFGSRIHPGDQYKGTVDVAERFCEVINEELKGLVAAGAEFIQIDEPARGNLSGEEMARLFNKATEGVKRSWRSTSASATASAGRASSGFTSLLPGRARSEGRPVRAGVREPRAVRDRSVEVRRAAASWALARST